MNNSMIRYILGHVLKLEAVFLLLPSFVALLYREPQGRYFLMTMGICLILGFAMTVRKPKSNVFYLKEGCISTALSWIFLSFFGSLPFWLSGEIPDFTNALFETVSGFTTTGASILSDVESLSYCSLFWRSFTHWIGGMGVLVFLLAVVPMSGGSNINLMRAESPGPSVGKLVPKIRHTARILYIIYLGFTVLEVIFLLFGGMSFFDALTLSFGTAGTGGFGIRNNSIAGYSAYIQWVITIFMLLFGINFNAYYLLLFGNLKKALSMEEVRCYLIIILVAIVLITFNILDMTKGLFDAFSQASFQVVSLITSTGYSTTDFNLWPQTSKVIIICLLFVGACAGSTGGGTKVSRLVILFKTLRKELTSYIHPKSIKKIKMDGKPLEHEVIRSVNVYFIAFFSLLGLSVLALSLEKNTDLVTTFTAVLTTINNIGPGLNMVGPAANFGFFSPFSKYVLIFDMLAGRLELFPLLILIHPAMWKEEFRLFKSRVKGSCEKVQTKKALRLRNAR